MIKGSKSNWNQLRSAAFLFRDKIGWPILDYHGSGMLMIGQQEVDLSRETRVKSIEINWGILSMMLLAHLHFFLFFNNEPINNGNVSNADTFILVYLLPI